jgi:hypothetical protein
VFDFFAYTVLLTANNPVGAVFEMAMVAGKRVQVGDPFWLRRNLTGTAPLFTGKTLLPSLLIGS